MEPIDPTGAGDCFCATFVTLWSKGAFSFGDAMARANAAGALAVTKVGPMEGNSDLTMIEALLQEGAMRQRDFWSKLIAANRAGERRGIPSWCTAHPQTLSAVLAAYRDNDEPILIEATCNQVNHEGGYTGMTPADFRRFIEGLARGAGVDPGRVILGGDHLGPNPWKRLPAKEAMARACDMVKAYVEAGLRQDPSGREHGLRR